MADALVHLVTGGTGFIGRALVLELLARTDLDVICLIRGTESSDEERLHRSLTEAAVAYGLEDLLRGAITRRCRAVIADLDDPLDDVAATLIGQVDQIWHCAASLRYLERDRDCIERTNVQGTGHMLRFAATVGANAFHYVSTAYVVGAADGHLPEHQLQSVASNNVYEETKLRAEKLVLGQAAAGLRVTILRPSVVVGHSVTSAASGSALSGLYGLGRQLAWYAAADGRPAGPIRIAVDANDTVNLVPIDQVAREAVSCGCTELTGPCTTSPPATR